MNQINAIVTLRPERLNFPAPTIYARQLHSFVIAFNGIPTDCTSVVMRLFRVDGESHFEIPVAVRGDGSGSCYIIGTCFPDCGNAFYEVHAHDSRGNMTALGRGAILIEEFTLTGDPAVAGVSRPVMQIADASGALHTIMAVYDGDSWTSVLDAPASGTNMTLHTITAVVDDDGNATSVIGD